MAQFICKEMANTNKKMAVLVGCNYPNTQYKLHGCINDVVSMQELLVKRFGFDPKSIEILVDEGSAYTSKVLPTGVNVKNALKKMINAAKPGDILFFHYSGHGTLIPSKHHLKLKHDEAIVPTDFNLITDVDFRELVNGLPNCTSFTILSDSCHSGGLINKEKEQIGPNTLSLAVPSNLDTNHPKPKKIPFQSIMDHLTSLTNKIEAEIGAHFTTLFGDDASLKFRLPEVDLDKWFGPQRQDSGILLSGCQSNETSADMPANGTNGKAHGAFSYAVQSVLKSNQGPLSNKEVVMLAREVLNKGGLERQHPCLYCSDENANAPFLMWK